MTKSQVASVEHDRESFLDFISANGRRIYDNGDYKWRLNNRRRPLAEEPM